MKNSKKLVALLACAALVAPLTGCSSKSNAKIAKAGFGMVTDAQAKGDDKSQINTTMATVGLDSDGKIAYLDIDVAQQTTDNAEKVQTKKELKEDYNMKGSSSIQKEWYEQIEALEQYAIGKTPEEFANIETEDRNNHKEAVKLGTDLASGCTIDIGSFKKAVAKAVENSEAVEAEKMGAGEIVSVNTKSKQVNTSVASVALDKDGKVVWANIDVAQTTHGDTDFRSKAEKKEEYNMKGQSGIGKEIYEQFDAYENFLKGKTADEVKKISYGADFKATDEDLKAGCTIAIGDIQSAINEAIDQVK